LFNTNQLGLHFNEAPQSVDKGRPSKKAPFGYNNVRFTHY